MRLPGVRFTQLEKGLFIGGCFVFFPEVLVVFLTAGFPSVRLPPTRAQSVGSKDDKTVV